VIVVIVGPTIVVSVPEVPLNPCAGVEGPGEPPDPIVIVYEPTGKGYAGPYTSPPAPPPPQDPLPEAPPPPPPTTITSTVPDNPETVKVPGPVKV
jgi:hypothetical protein